jgi:MarR family 2-MHQ and catechol resistance regulon transcriptional repressor
MKGSVKKKKARFGPPAPFEPPAWVAEGLGRPTGKGLLVAVIDSGWDHACDDPRVLPGIGLVDPADELAMLRTDDDQDRVGHGTACIHQILRIAPDARVVPIRVFGKVLDTGPEQLYEAILYAIDRGVDVVNLSLGTMLPRARDPLYFACETARRKGIIVVAAGSNSGGASYPAIFENVIGVSADRFGSPYDFEYHVDEAMECRAWGVEQPVVGLGGAEEVKHGTSFATPNIAGIVCLLLERYPGASLERIRDLLAGHATLVVQPPEESLSAPSAVPTPSAAVPSPPVSRRSRKRDASPSALAPAAASGYLSSEMNTESDAAPAREAPDEETALALRTWIALARAHNAVGARATADVARHDLTVAEFGVLEALYHKGPMLLSEVQRRILVSSGGITYLVDRLVKRGLVERRDCPGDRRARLAALTAAGEQLVADIFPEHAAVIRDALAGLGPEEKRQAIRLLHTILGGARPEPGPDAG